MDAGEETRAAAAPTEAPATYISQLFYLWPFSSATSSPALPAAQQSAPSTEQQTDFPTMTDARRPPSTTGSASVNTLGEQPIPSFVSNVLLACWDDLLGPQIVKAWPSLRNDEQKESMLRVARHTLCSDIERTPGNEVEPRFHVIGEQGLTVTTLVFSSFIVGGNAPSQSIFSLSVVAPIQNQQVHLAYYPFFLERLPLFVTRFKASRKRLAPNPSASPPLLPLAQRQQLHASSLDMLTIHVAGLQEEIAEISVNNLVAESPLSNTIFGSEYEGLYNDRSFLWRAISSHLQTGGRTVVLGSDSASVNVFINSLAIFLPVAHRKCSRRARREFNRFIPDAYLQGLILTADRSTILPDARILESRSPTTIVDLTRFQVEQTDMLHLYTRTREDYFKQEGERIATDGSFDPDTVLLHNALFRVVKEYAPAVKQLVTECYRLPFGIRKQFTSEFRRVLARRAHALLQVFEEQRNNATDPASAQSALQTAVRRVRPEIDLDDDTMFYIVLTLTEGLRPGSYHDLYGEANFVIEDPFREVMQSFG